MIKNELLNTAAEYAERAKMFREEAEYAGLWGRDYIRKHHQKIVDMGELFANACKLREGIK